MVSVGLKDQGHLVTPDVWIPAGRASASPASTPASAPTPHPHNCPIDPCSTLGLPLLRSFLPLFSESRHRGAARDHHQGGLSPRHPGQDACSQYPAELPCSTLGNFWVVLKYCLRQPDRAGARRPWANYITFLGLSFLISPMG